MNNWVIFTLLLAFFGTPSYAAKFIKITDQNFKQFFTQKQKSVNAKTHESEFILVNSVYVSNTEIKNKFIQYYQGVKVYGSILTESDNSGVHSKRWGRYLVGINKDIKSFKAKLTPEGAILKAKAIMNLNTNAKTDLEKAELFIKLNNQNEAQLVYLVSFNITGANPSRPHMFVDAITGEIIHKWEGLTTKDAQGPGGNIKIGKYYYGKDFTNLNVSDDCAMKNDHVVTINMQGEMSGGKIFKFTCPVNTFKEINGAYSPLNDAHYFGGVVYDMYMNWYKMDPIKMLLKMRVHYGDQYENAYWDGQQMTFGDGGDYLYPLTVLDVTGHEISHGVTELNSDLAYEGQSGGINEAFSDMAGQTVQYYVRSQIGKENDWMVGADVIKGPAGNALRYFQDPKLDGSSIDNAEDYTDGLDVHYSSGVFNKAFYNLATSNDWGIKKAFEVFLLANRVYWTSNSNFNDAACGVSKAAADLNYDTEAVKNSFSAVGVIASCDEPIPPRPDEEIELTNGQKVDNIKVEKDKEVRYFIKLPVLKSYPYVYKYLLVRLYANHDDAKEYGELFIRYDSSSPNKDKFLSTKDEVFTITSPDAGYYHILIKGKRSGTLNLFVSYGK